MKLLIAILLASVLALLGVYNYVPSGSWVLTPPDVPVVPGVAAANELEAVGLWVQIDPYEGYDPDTLEFADGCVTLTEMYGSSPEITGPMAYHLSSNGTIEVDQTREMNFCEFLELQRVEIAGQTVPIVSQYLFEYDGRGALIVTEYAPVEYVDLFPAGYQSERMRETREVDGSSMMVP